jgi:hypothetical protein
MSTISRYKKLFFGLTLELSVLILHLSEYLIFDVFIFMHSLVALGTVVYGIFMSILSFG